MVIQKLSMGRQAEADARADEATIAASHAKKDAQRLEEEITVATAARTKAEGRAEWRTSSEDEVLPDLVGDEDAEGDTVSLCGDGDTEGPHLHFEVWKNDEVLDPRKFIEIYKTRDVSIQ